jgi:hypothetical protein
VASIALFSMIIIVFSGHKTTQFCLLNLSDSLIEYQCAYGLCDAYHINNSVVSPKCKLSRDINLSTMRCVNGQWNTTASCPECGRVDANGLPTWHVNFNRNSKHVCGGSLISAKAILSAAHCFWHPTRQLLPANEFEAVAGNLRSNLSSIIVTDYFMDFEGSYQDDIAVVQLITPFVYTLSVTPICIDYTYDYPCNVMKTPSYGLTDTIKMINLTKVPLMQCLQKIRWDLKGFVTADKSCAEDGSSLCLGDGGNGIVFKDYSNRYFLTGVVSRFFLKQNTCNMFNLTLYTDVHWHINTISEVLLK